MDPTPAKKTTANTSGGRALIKEFQEKLSDDSLSLEDIVGDQRM